MKAIRVDPGMFYPHYRSADAAIDGVLRDLLRWKANAVFLFAVSPLYGSYYQTDHPAAEKSERIPGESYLRAENLLPRFVEAARDAGLDVIASFRLNQYQRLAELHPDWVSHTANGPYRTEIYGSENWITPLSAHVPEYRESFRSLVADAVDRMPRLSGVEACEGNVAEAAEEGDAMPDRHPIGWATFRERFPQGTVGDLHWRSHRAAAMTDLHRTLLNGSGGRTAYVVHDLPTLNLSYFLQESKPYARACGFDWDDVVDLGYVPILSAIWQQREAEARAAGRLGRYTPEWTALAAQEFRQRYRTRQCLTHVEVTPFGPVVPTPPEFAEALHAALDVSMGVTVYSYDQLKESTSDGYVDNPFAHALADAFARY